MSMKINDDMVPRPLPKPSQVEVIPVRPEVPEVSLIFDQYSSNGPKNSNEYQPDFRMQTIKSSYPLDQRHEDVLKQNRVRELSNEDQFLTPNQIQNETRQIHKKVSFSPHTDGHDYFKPPSRVCNVTDYNNYQNDRDSLNCRCSNYDTNLSNDPKCTSKYSNRPNTPRFSYIAERFTENEIYSKKLCSCAHCLEDLKHNSCTRHTKEQTFVSAEELENMVLKFENMFLNLNYKLSQITENFVSKEDFNALRQKYEDRLKSMQEHVDKLAEKNKEIDRSECRCKNHNQTAPMERTDNGTSASCYTSSNGVNGLDWGSTNLNSRDKQHENGNISTGKYNSDFMKECREKYTKIELTPEISKNQGAKPVIFENNSPFSIGTCLNLDRQRENDAKMEHLTIDQNRNQQRSDFPNKNMNKQYQPKEEESRRNEMTSFTLPDTQLKRMYHDIVMQVRGIIEAEKLLHVDKTVDPTLLIKKATIEQFRKMGVNVENINNEEKNQSHGNEDSAPRNLMNVKNSVPSSDLSLHMNALAMKYISDHPSENEFQRKKSSSNDVSINYNNISVATLQYLERYQLLPTSDNTIGHNKCERNSSDQRNQFYEQFQGNDRSFIR